MRLIPVLDLLTGRAVHAAGGNRDHYQPLRSILHEGSGPIEIASAFRDVLGLRDLYLADLDAIAGNAPSLELYRSLAELGLSLWIDAGLRHAGLVPTMLDAQVGTIVAGLETLESPDDLSAIVDAAGPSRVVFSLDLRDGVPLGSWGMTEPIDVVQRAVDSGARSILVLDLAEVGNNRGFRSHPILEAIRRQHPDLELSTGGGVRGMDDLVRLDALGLSSVLLASALHDGRIGRGDIKGLLEKSEGAGRIERDRKPCGMELDRSRRKGGP